MQERTTLKHFLDIIGKENIFEYICYVYLIENDEKSFGENLLRFNDKGYLGDIANLEPYYDYEIVKFDVELYYGEIDRQIIILRK